MAHKSASMRSLSSQCEGMIVPVAMGRQSECLMFCLQVPQVAWCASSCKSSCLHLRQLRQLPASRGSPSPPEAWQSEQGALSTCLPIYACLASAEQLAYMGASAVASADACVCSVFHWATEVLRYTLPRSSSSAGSCCLLAAMHTDAPAA